MRLLYEMMKTGQMLATPDEEQVLYEDGEELWMPVHVIPSENFDGAWYRTTAYSIPKDACVDDPRLWANLMYASENDGATPDFQGDYGRCE
ncbi:MAG: hypothetical protein U0521_27955 [Anaerolineae bacterium]